MINILLIAVFVIIAVAACTAFTYLIQSITCQNCPLKEECLKASKEGKTPPCQNNIHSNPFINDQFSNGL
ncbi:hypothetical protein D0T60_01720 [Bacteroides sp. 224]|nr:hypothetical protein [Bacteroides sp. 224]